MKKIKLKRLNLNKQTVSSLQSIAGGFKNPCPPATCTASPCGATCDGGKTCKDCSGTSSPCTGGGGGSW